jgi:hypothetical protein
MINKMLAIVFMMFVSVTAFGASSTDITPEYVLPKEMKGCQIFYLRGGGFSYSSIYVTHCPNAMTDTSFPSGKTVQHVVSGRKSIIDDSIQEPEVVEINGAKYVKVPD